MTRYNQFKVVFFITLIAGIAFLIAGFFVVPLLGPGAALLAAAAGFYNGAFVPINTVETQGVEFQPVRTAEPSQMTINIDNRQMTFTPMFDHAHEHKSHNVEVHKAQSAPQLTLS